VPTVGEILADTDDIGVAGAGLTALASQASVNTIDDILDTEFPALVTAVDALPTNAELATALGTADDAVLAQIALVKAQTDLIPSDPADASVVAGLIAGVAAQLPAALTGDGNIKADVLAVSGDTTAADRLEALMDGIVVAQVNDAGATTTVFIADGFSEGTSDHFNGRLITFISGALSGQQTAITDYNGGTQAITVTALTEAPANNDFFVIH
jgi:hypothetical protein